MANPHDHKTDPHLGNHLLAFTVCPDDVNGRDRQRVDAHHGASLNPSDIWIHRRDERVRRRIERIRPIQINRAGGRVPDAREDACR